jgi:hypothetical protein
VKAGFACMLVTCGLLVVPVGAAAQSDLSPPETTITEAPANPTSDRSATFSFTGSDDTTPVDELEFECRLDITDAQDPLGEQWVECLSPQFFSGLLTGQHTFEVRALDAEENIDPTPARHTWTILPPQTCAEAGATVPATADSWIGESSPLDVKGDDSTLKVQSKAPADNMRALVRFALPSAPAGCVVASATLRLYAPSASPDPRTLQAYRLASAWGENNVSWANQPQTAGGPAQTGMGAGYVEWNVAGQVQAMYSSGQHHGFLVRDASEGDIAGAEQQFHSREKLETVPELVLSFGGTAAGGGGGSGLSPRTVARRRNALRADLLAAARMLRRLGISGLLRRGGARIRGVSAQSAGVVRMEARMRVASKSGAAARVVVLRGRRSFSRAGQGTLRLRLTKRGRRALARRRSARLTLHGSFTDRARNKTRATVRVALARRGRR